MSLKAKIIRSRKINKKETQVTTQFYKQKKELLDRNDVDNLLEQINDRGNKKHKRFRVHLIRVLNGANWVSFTNFDNYNDYYDGKVSNMEKFLEFSQVQITFIYS
jgi:hypothetical protein